MKLKTKNVRHRPASHIPVSLAATPGNERFLKAPAGALIECTEAESPAKGRDKSAHCLWTNPTFARFLSQRSRRQLEAAAGINKNGHIWQLQTLEGTKESAQASRAKLLKSMQNCHFARGDCPVPKPVIEAEDSEYWSAAMHRYTSGQIDCSSFLKIPVVVPEVKPGQPAREPLKPRPKTRREVMLRNPCPMTVGRLHEL